MDFEKAKKGLKRFGLIWVICGAFLLIIGIIMIIGGRAAAADAERAVDAAKFTHAGITNIILGLIGLDSGYRCFKAVKDPKKLKDVHTIAVIFIGFAILGLLVGYMRSTLSASYVSTCIVSIVISGLLLYETIIAKKGFEAEKNDNA